MKLIRRIIRHFRFCTSGKAPCAVKEEVTLTNTAGKPVFSVIPSCIIYIRSIENYVSIRYVESNGKVQEKCIRSTLHNAEQAFSPHLVRCHRSYLFNPKHLVRYLDFPGDSRLQLYEPQIVEIPVTITHKSAVLKAVQLLTGSQKAEIVTADNRKNG